MISKCNCPNAARRGCDMHGPQPREHAVPCRVCGVPTWNVMAVCDRDYDAFLATRGNVA